MSAGGTARAPGHRFGVLDSLRGLVAMLVAAHHLNSRGPILGQPVFMAGVQFVDFFFVLSGFVIAATYGDRLREGYPPSRFLWLRLGRIYPAHFAMVMCYVAIEAAAALAPQAGLTVHPPFSGPRDVAFLPAVLLLAQALWPAATMSWNVQSWSISVEMVLYLLVAFLWRPAGRWWWALSLAVALGGGLALALELLDPWNKLIRGFCGFGLGVALWPLWRRCGDRLAAAPRHATTFVEIALVAGAAWIFAKGEQGPLTLVANAWFALAVVVFAAERGGISRLLLRGPFLLLGTLSYAIYMVHPLVETVSLTIARIVLAREGHDGAFGLGSESMRPVPMDLIGDIAGLAALACVVGAAYLFYNWYEWPLRRLSRAHAARIGGDRRDCSFS